MKYNTTLIQDDCNRRRLYSKDGRSFFFSLSLYRNGSVGAMLSLIYMCTASTAPCPQIHVFFLVFLGGVSLSRKLSVFPSFVLYGLSRSFLIFSYTARYMWMRLQKNLRPLLARQESPTFTSSGGHARPWPSCSRPWSRWQSCRQKRRQQAPSPARRPLSGSRAPPDQAVFT